MTSDDTQWRNRSACFGLDTDDFFPTQGKNLAPETKATCATCPVFVPCLVDSLQRREGHGGWAGAGTGTRRVLWRAWMARTHDYRPGCQHEDCWCRTVDAHRQSLTAPRSERVRVDLNGPNATHGRASTYARGCGAPGPACGACTLAYSPVGKRLRNAGVDVLTWWRTWFGDDLSRGDADARYERARVLANIDLAEATAA